jgi:hypothetical protein
MLYREIIAVCSEIHNKHINAARGRNAEFLYVEAGGSYTYRCALKEEIPARP